MIKPTCESFDLRGLTIWPQPSQNKDNSSARVGDEQIVIRRCANQPWLPKSAFVGRLRAMLLIGRRTWSVIAPGIQRYLESRRRNGPCVLGPTDDVRLVPNRF